MNDPTHPASARPSEETASRRRRKRRRVALLLLVLAVVFHRPLLRNVGRAFTVSDPVGPWDAVVVLGGDHRVEVVQKLLETDRVGRVWLIDGRPDYLVRSGIMPSPASVAAAELGDAGVSLDRLELIEADEAVNVADFARVVRSRLQQQPDTRVLVLCRDLDGRHVRMVFDDVLGGKLAASASIRGLPSDEYDVEEWWRSRSGLKQVFGEVCAFGFTLTAGTDPREPPVAVDPEAMEAALRERFGGNACEAD